MASRAVHLSVGICVIVGGFCVLNSQGKSTHHVEKRASESLYDNIYSAIADFKSEDQAQQESDEAREKRQTFASLQGQLPRGGKLTLQDYDPGPRVPGLWPPVDEGGGGGGTSTSILEEMIRTDDAFGDYVDLLRRQQQQRIRRRQSRRLRRQNDKQDEILSYSSLPDFMPAGGDNYHKMSGDLLRNFDQSSSANRDSVRFIVNPQQQQISDRRSFIGAGKEEINESLTKDKSTLTSNDFFQLPRSARSLLSWLFGSTDDDENEEKRDQHQKQHQERMEMFEKSESQDRHKATMIGPQLPQGARPGTPKPPRSFSALLAHPKHGGATRKVPVHHDHVLERADGRPLHANVLNPSNPFLKKLPQVQGPQPLHHGPQPQQHGSPTLNNNWNKPNMQRFLSPTTPRPAQNPPKGIVVTTAPQVGRFSPSWREEGELLQGHESGGGLDNHHPRPSPPPANFNVPSSTPSYASSVFPTSPNPTKTPSFSSIFTTANPTPPSHTKNKNPFQQTLTHGLPPSTEVVREYRSTSLPNSTPAPPASFSSIFTTAFPRQTTTAESTTKTISTTASEPSFRIIKVENHPETNIKPTITKSYQPSVVPPEISIIEAAITKRPESNPETTSVRVIVVPAVKGKTVFSAAELKHYLQAAITKEQHSKKTFPKKYVNSSPEISDALSKSKKYFSEQISNENSKLSSQQIHNLLGEFKHSSQPISSPHNFNGHPNSKYSSQQISVHPKSQPKSNVKATKLEDTLDINHNYPGPPKNVQFERSVPSNNPFVSSHNKFPSIATQFEPFDTNPHHSSSSLRRPPKMPSFSISLIPENTRLPPPGTRHPSAALVLPGRQEQRRVIVDGFPTGLPNGTPRGVQIALASLAETGEMPPIPGEAGVDFPVYPEVPVTGFDCGAQTFPGIYADTEAQCQVFHMCQPNGNYNSFLCPNGTVFNQQYFICDWWYNFDCGAAENFYGLNEFLYEENPEENGLVFLNK